MKNSATFLCALLCTLIYFETIQAQSPYYPLYNSKEHIPYGMNLPLPDVKNNKKNNISSSKQETFQIPQIYFDTISKKFAVKGYNQNSQSISSTKPTAYKSLNTANFRTEDFAFRLTKDINTSTRSSTPANSTANGPQYAILNGVIYFTADDGIHGVELWRSDGTDAGNIYGKRYCSRFGRI